MNEVSPYILEYFPLVAEIEGLDHEILTQIHALTEQKKDVLETYLVGSLL